MDLILKVQEQLYQTSLQVELSYRLFELCIVHQML